MNVRAKAKDPLARALLAAGFSLIAATVALAQDPPSPAAGEEAPAEAAIAPDTKDAALALEKEGRWLDAAAVWKRVVAATDGAARSEAHAGEARCLLAFADETLSAGDAGSSIRAAFEDARRALERAEAAGGASMETALGIARCDDAEGKAADQIRVLETAVKRFPDDPRGPRALAFALLNASREAEALPLFRKLSDADPKDDKLALCLSRCARVSGDDALAVSAAARRIAADPHDRRGWEHLWAVYAPTKRWAELAAVLAKTNAETPSGVAAHYLGFAYSAAGETEKALEWLAKAAEGEPRNIGVRVEQARLLLSQKRDRNAASKILRAAIASAPDNDSVASLLSFVAQKRSEDNDHAGAVADLEAITAARPGDGISVSNLALELRWNGEYDRAEATYRKALELRPMDPVIWNDLGLLYIVRERIADATATFEKGTEVDPLFNDNVENLAFLARADGRTEDALAWFRRAYTAAIRRGEDGARHRRNCDDARFPLPAVPVPKAATRSGIR